LQSPGRVLSATRRKANVCETIAILTLAGKADGQVEELAVELLK